MHFSALKALEGLVITVGAVLGTKAMGRAANAWRKAPDLSIRSVDLGANISDPVASLPVIYGESRVGGTIVLTKLTAPHEDPNNGSAYLWAVYSLSEPPSIRRAA